jgi:tetratricopeptide (TPR) repeat protein
VEQFLSGAGPEGPEAALWRAEVAAYLLRLDEAAALLNEVKTDRPELICRRELVAAEIALACGQLGEADELLTEAVQRAEREGSAFLAMRGRLCRARLARMKGEWNDSLTWAALAHREADDLGNPFYAGLALFNQGVCLAELGDASGAETSYHAAIERLRSTEDLRFRALAEHSLAGLLLASGQTEMACALSESADETLSRAGLISDAQLVCHGLAWARFARGQVDEAIRCARTLIDFDRAQGDSRAVMWGLKAMTVFSCVANHLDEARSFAEEFARVASLAGAESDRLEAELLLARAQAKSGDYEAFPRLLALVERIEKSGDTLLAITARLCVADALLGVDHARAYRAYLQVRGAAVAARGPWIYGEAAALDRAWRRMGIQREGDEIRINLRADLPSRESLMTILDWELMSAALDRKKGCFAAAGRLLGEKRWNARDLWLRVNIRMEGPPIPPEFGRNGRRKRPRVLRKKRQP